MDKIYVLCQNDQERLIEKHCKTCPHIADLGFIGPDGKFYTVCNSETCEHSETYLIKGKSDTDNVIVVRILKED